MSIYFSTRPLLSWPRPVTAKRKHGPYSVNYVRSMKDLEYEIGKIGGEGEVVIQIDVNDGEIRRDGLPYAGVRPRTPKVAISFHSKHGPLTYYCDRFLDWTDNVRAIGVGLQRLRLVEEAGIVSRGEQYVGFKALPLADDPNSPSHAAKVVAVLAGDVTVTDILLSKEVYDRCWRAACMKAHPDRGGDAAQFTKLQHAGKVLDNYFSQKKGG